MASTSRKVFFDANVILDAALARRHKAVADDVLRAASGYSHISSLSAHLLIHFGKRSLDLATLKFFLDDFTILSLESVDFEWAYANTRDDDFEDALQLAVAIRHGCTEFTTFDKKLYKTYKSLPNIRVKIA